MPVPQSAPKPAPKTAPKLGPKGRHVQLFKTGREVDKGSWCLSIRMQATEWYLSCAHEDKCSVLSLFEGQAGVCNECSMVCVVHKRRLVQTPRPCVSTLFLNLAHVGWGGGGGTNTG